MLRSVLEALEMTHKEIVIFMKLLELGSQPASNIARVCEMPRNTVRSILDKLVKNGYLVKTSRANTQYYATEKRETIIRNLKVKKMKADQLVDRQVEMLQKYGEELTLRHHSKTRPKITFYEGYSGMEKVYEDTLTSKSGLKSFASYDALMGHMPEYFLEYFKRRAKKKIHMKSIHPKSKYSIAGKKRDKAELRESYLVPADKFNWKPEVQVYDNKVNIVSWDERIGIIIESEEIAEAMNAIFDMAYEYAKNSEI